MIGNSLPLTVVPDVNLGYLDMLTHLRNPFLIFLWGWGKVRGVFHVAQAGLKTPGLPASGDYRPVWPRSACAFLAYLC